MNDVLDKIQKPCVEWMDYRTPDGYGMQRHGGTMKLSHRVAWEEAYGPIPEGQQVLHKCDNRGCIRPEHLFLGTNAVNVADRHAKGRDAKGEGNGNARLTEEEVKEIKWLYDNGFSRSELSKIYGVWWKAINEIVKGISWRHVS